MKNIINFAKERKKEFIILGISFILFLILSILVIMEKVVYLDTLVHSFILDIRNDSLTSFFNIITNLAGASFLLALSVIMLIVMKKKKISLYVLINLISAFIINETAKAIFTRSRPVGINLIDETGFSFPSGHTMVALSFYGFIVFLLYNKTKNKAMRMFFIIGLIAVVLLVGFSRIYLGVHYLSDVIGGLLLSIMYLTIFINFVKLEKKWLYESNRNYCWIQSFSFRTFVSN